MLNLKKAAIYKAIAAVLCIVMVFEAHYLFAFQASNSLQDKFEEARESFLAADYESARITLEGYIAQLESQEGFIELRGQTYLLLGATYEALKNKELAVKYYCYAKDILGTGVTLEGIQLVKQRWYWAKCPRTEASITGKKKRRNSGALIGTLVGIGIFASFIWYFFISKNSPLKFEKNGDTGNGDENYVFLSSCFTTEWEVEILSDFGGEPGEVIVTPWPVVGPIPTESNGWISEVEITISINGAENLRYFGVAWRLSVGGGDQVRRFDEIYLINNRVWTEENNFDEPCTDIEKIEVGEVLLITTPGTHKVKIETTLEKN